ncbi:D-beta-D-heptose 7-phosphate kinase/D-beta-D-heptose 1-phosphate adenosyltransferase [Brevundimonas mediterranea]|uniref:Bifunctional protein HldE n=2 Tax=Brevundimonas mediterranea TaxID=74329 RepID=A0A7W6F0F7_9CAUL|nr:D-beta-D-heptose 7-phosphate kinase/D-beta-D-heptose 1-phosphate adenosyltransferase [Brevundimonas mediterranea]
MAVTLTDKDTVRFSGENLFDPRMKILVLGDVMLDGYASGDVERISPEAPVPVLKHMGHHEVAGGAANVAMNIAALGGFVTLIGIVGQDPEAARLTTILESGGVTTRLVAVAGRHTTSKVRILAGNHQMLRMDKEHSGSVGVDVEELILTTVDAALPNVAAIVLSDYEKGCLSDRVLSVVISRARLAGVKIFVDPKRRNFSDYRGAHFITPNRKELTAATGIACRDDANCKLAAQRAAEASGASILLTRSEEGLSLFSVDDEDISLATDAKEVFDVSGAGDTVVSVFAYAITSGASPLLALKAANAAAGLVIARAGTATTSAREVVKALELKSASGRAEVSPHVRQASLEDAVLIRRQWEGEGLTVGFTNGCFDLLHPGHISLLRQASEYCDRLVVGLNTDASVRRLKGTARPVQNEAARADVMAAVRFVDLVVMFDEDTPQNLIAALEPDLLVKGADYQEDQIVGADIVKKRGGAVVRVDIVAGQSTSNLIARSQSEG